MTGDAPRTLLEALSGYDDHMALIDAETGASLTLQEMLDQVHHIATQLAVAGVSRGGSVAYAAPNSLLAVTSFLAVTSLGAAAAPLNPSYTEAEFVRYLTDLRPTGVLHSDTTPVNARRASVAAGVPSISFDAAVVDRHGRLDQAQPDDVALLLHTSGTTGPPKTVPIRQRNLVASLANIRRTYDLSSADVSYCVMPLFHVHGLVASTLAAMSAGGTVVVSPRFSARRFWSDVASHQVTWYSAVPTIHQTLVSSFEPDNRFAAQRLRFARSCSSALTAVMQESYESLLDVPLVQAYGMTEATHQMTSNSPPPAARILDSVGLPTGTEVSVVDDAWRHLAAGQSGEIVVRGTSVVDGYRDNAEANAASFRDGWFRTGDSGSLDDAGYLFLRGRLKELINRGGEKISPHEVEDALLSHEAVGDAAAFSLPDSRFGEVVGAMVVLRSSCDEAELTAHCRKRLAAFKVPARIIIVEQIPKGPTGKVQRRALAEGIGS